MSSTFPRSSRIYSGSYDNLSPRSPAWSGGYGGSTSNLTNGVMNGYYNGDVVDGGTRYPVTDTIRRMRTTNATRGRFLPGSSRPVYRDDLWSSRRYGPLSSADQNLSSWMRRQQSQDDSILRVEHVDLNKDENERQHNTERYEVEELVVRRGQPFIIDVHFNRAPGDGEQIKLQFTTGKRPQQAKNSLVRLQPEPKGSETPIDEWSCRIIQEKGGAVTYAVMPSVDALVGEYKLYVEMHGSGQQTVPRRYENRQEIYIIFNPWCQEDEVYMKNAAHREEYVMNDFGIIYMGTSEDIVGRPWYFGQFEDVCIKSACRLLELSYLEKVAQGNPVQVARALSCMTNSNSIASGVLTGNWSGQYFPHVPPAAWNGSVPILDRYIRNVSGYQTDVKFGQCWVFSGVLTTLCRALGMPTRSVTNFESAHDRDKSLTVDFHRAANGRALPHLDDSVWNFHVWNEAWFRRPDLPEGMDGWQAFDATPQELSKTQIGGGKSITAMQCGPAPVKAIKGGHVYFKYDADFIYTEVNGDRVTWEVNQEGELNAIRIDPNSIGQNISTKAVGSDERQDITDQYKYPEGSKEERAAAARAARHNRCLDKVKQAKIKELHAQPVEVAIKLEGQQGTSGDLSLRLTLSNNKAEPRTVKMTWFLQAKYYNGVTGESLMERDQTIPLGPNEGKAVTWTLRARDYIPQLDADAALHVYVLATVMESRRKYVDYKTFPVIKPKIQLQVNPKRVRPGEEFRVTVTFTNPLGIDLSDGIFYFEGAGCTHDKKLRIKRSLKPGEAFSDSITLRAEPKGKSRRELLVSLSTLQIDNIVGSAFIEVQ